MPEKGRKFGSKKRSRAQQLKLAREKRSGGGKRPEAKQTQKRSPMAAYDRKKTKAAAPTHDTRLSRQLSKLLRHRLHDAGLTDCLRPDGFVPVGRVLACLPEGATVDALRRVVEDNDKQRFALLEEAGALYVRANQGHSVSLGLDDAAMMAEVSAAEAEDLVCVHGTYLASWPAIRAGGLNRMKRRHVHFAAAVDASKVISGMRRTAEVLVYLDAAKAVAAGLKLYRSANGVLLSPGDERGVVSPAFSRASSSRHGQRAPSRTRTAARGRTAASAASQVTSHGQGELEAARRRGASSASRAAARAPPPTTMFASREDRGGDQSSSEEHALKERKFRDITSYLVSAGYFRARSERVSRFDRVVGGMCWCITHSHTALDVDVLFRTQSTTGQNIKLAESIVHCVRDGLPVSLQAHQIHGQDWVNVHPVIAWLIKTMFEARAARFERLGAFSAQQFSKNFDAVQLGGAPRRGTRTSGPRERDAAAAAAVAGGLEDAGAGTVAGGKMRDMVRLQADEIAAVKRARGGPRGRAAALSGGGGDALARDAKAHATALEAKLAKARGAVGAKQATNADRVAAVKSRAQQRCGPSAEREAFNAKVDGEVDKLKALEAKIDGGKRRDLAELKRLVANNENFKRQEAAFANCKAQLADLQAQAQASGPDAALDARLAEIEAVHAKVATKLDETKKYYELYNSLDEIVKVHAKEVTILNSILDTFQTATKSKQGKQSFLDQLDEMNSGLAKNLAKKKEGLKASGDRASEAHANHQALVEQHRNYHAAIKDFHDECQKNEMLLARVEEAG
ncbi:Coiled-coil domain-containing protein 93 [Aureococcus anophagefferens]|nr:Coiled-coil domain-containing protein 93 [Aureococcus anophagefferens]